MNDIRLKMIPFEFDGKDYELRCNFNVLADIIDYYGKLPNFLGNISLSLYSAVLAFMMNEYADVKGWKEKFTPREVGRKLSVKMLKDDDEQRKMIEIIGLVIDSLYSKTETEVEEKN